MAIVPVILLDIHFDTLGYPPAPEAHPDLKGQIPWRKAQAKRSDLTNDKRRVGHRPKVDGYFYRFRGGNSIFANSKNTNPPNGTPVGDGDFELDLFRGASQVVVQMGTITPAPPPNFVWQFHSISLSGPLLQTNSLPDTDIELTVDTNNNSVTSGQIGMVVELAHQISGVVNKSLYVDPDWDNR